MPFTLAVERRPPKVAAHPRNHQDVVLSLGGKPKEMNHAKLRPLTLFEM